MIHIKLKNLEKSEMEHSPMQAGPDLFKLKLHVLRGRYNGIIVEKAHANLYIAVTEVVDHMLESLNRFGDRARVKERQNARQIADKIEQGRDTRDQKIR